MHPSLELDVQGQGIAEKQNLMEERRNIGIHGKNLEGIGRRNKVKEKEEEIRGRRDSWEVKEESCEGRAITVKKKNHLKRAAKEEYHIMVRKKDQLN